jgi:hypothetical protein
VERAKETDPSRKWNTLKIEASQKQKNRLKSRMGQHCNRRNNENIFRITIQARRRDWLIWHF